MISTLTALCITAFVVNGNDTSVVTQRFEPCPVVEHVKFAPEIKYPTAKECKGNPKLERCG